MDNDWRGYTPAKMRWERDEMLLLAARGVNKADRWGYRGTTLISAEETAAMAAALVVLAGMLETTDNQKGNHDDNANQDT